MSTTFIGACLAVIAMHFYLRKQPHAVGSKRGTIAVAALGVVIAVFLLLRIITTDDPALRAAMTHALASGAVVLLLWVVLHVLFPGKK